MIQRSLVLLCVIACCSSESVKAFIIPNIRPKQKLNFKPFSIDNRINHGATSSKLRILSAATSTITSSSLASAGSSSLVKSPFVKQVITVSSMALASVSGCLNPTIVGGLLSGGLHAVSGPDHLAALLPPSVGKSGWYGLKLGATWGLGHGVSAIFLGMCAFFLKGRMSEQFSILQKMGKYTEAAVGLSLFVIGAIGVKENLDLRKQIKRNSEGGVSDSDESETLSKMSMTTFKSSVSIFLNGILHGFSWDGAPSIAPALAMTSWRSALSFLFSYCLGTMAAMSFTAGAFGEGSLRLGKVFNNDNLPMNLSFASSVLAILIGLYWIAQALLLR